MHIGDAIQSVGREVLLVKNNKIVGEGYAISSADYIVGVEMRDDRAKALVADSEQVKAWAKHYPDKAFKYSSFHFSELTGVYTDWDDGRGYYCAALDEVRVVDKRNLGYGMVPDSFKDTEGYREVILSMKGEQ